MKSAIECIDDDTKNVDDCSMNEHIFETVSNIETRLTFSPSILEFRVSSTYTIYVFLIRKIFHFCGFYMIKGDEKILKRYNGKWYFRTTDKSY